MLRAIGGQWPSDDVGEEAEWLGVMGWLFVACLNKWFGMTLL
jgi:hypothetical protein